MPNVVKGSKQEQMVVVPYRPYQRRLYHLSLTALLLLGIGAAFILGRQTALEIAGINPLDQQLRSNAISNLESENAELRLQLAVFDRSSVMDSRANEEVQLTIKTLRDRVAQLEQDILFYRQVVSDDTESSGLMIGQMDIESSGVPSRYYFKLVMRQQQADGDTFLVGHVNVNLVGRQGQEQVVIPLRDLTDTEDQLDIRLRFKYFQNIEGELQLPLGFQPEQVHIAAVSLEPSEKTVNKIFSWVVEGD
jgi:hypothetical protein